MTAKLSRATNHSAFRHFYFLLNYSMSTGYIPPSAEEIARVSKQFAGVNMPRMLPIITIEEKQFFVDDRLHEIRNVTDLAERYDLSNIILPGHKLLEACEAILEFRNADTDDANGRNRLWVNAMKLVEEAVAEVDGAETKT
jgi:hypothetical protein